jgi:two-component system sensor kinase FixL
MIPETRAHSELQALLEAAVDAIIMIDLGGQILAMNRAAEKLFGYSAEEALGRNIGLFMPKAMAAEHDQHLARYIATGEARVIGRGREVEACRRDGSTFPAHLSVGRVPNSDPVRFIGFVHDLTQRREAEEQSRLSQARLAQVARFAAMGEMAAGIAHELNQPLSAIATYAQACDRMLDGADPDLPEIHAALKQISAQAMRAGEVIRRLRHMVSNRQTDRSILPVDEVVQELATLANTDARNASVELVFELARGDDRVSIDRVQVQQVLLNLLRNAIEALEGLGPERRTITIGTRHLEDEEIEIFVRDRGPGVPQETVDRMFDPFYTTKRTGTGLGLAISRTIARAHRGTLGHRPNPQGGAEFFFRLPRAEQETKT